MLSFIVRRLLHSLVLFSYLNVLIVQSWAVTNPVDDHYQYKLSIKSVPRIVGEDAPQNSASDLQLKYTRSDDLYPNHSYQDELLVPYKTITRELLNAGCRERFLEQTGDLIDKSSIGFSWKAPSLAGLEFLIMWDGSLLVKGNKTQDTSSMRLKLSTSGNLGICATVLQSAYLKAKQVEFYQNNVIDDIHIDFATTQGEACILSKASLTTRSIGMSGGVLHNEGRLLSCQHQDLTFDIADLKISSQATITAGGKITGHLTQLINQGMMTAHQGYALNADQIINTRSAQLNGAGRLKVNNVNNEGIIGSDLLQLNVANQFNNLGIVRLQHLDGTGTFDNQGTLVGSGQADQPMSIGIHSFSNHQRSEADDSGQISADYLTFLSSVNSWSHTSGLIAIDQKLSFDNTASLLPMICKGNIQTKELDIAVPKFEMHGKAKVRYLNLGTLASFNADFKNTGHIEIQDDLKGYCRHFENQGIITAQNYYLITHDLMNHKTAHMLGDGIIDTFRGRNEGILGSPYLSLTVNQQFTNNATLHFSDLLGRGNFDNHGTLCSDQPEFIAHININGFCNEAKATIKDSGRVIGQHLIFGSSVKHWLFNSGLLNVRTLDLHTQSSNTLLLDGNIIKVEHLNVDTPSLRLSNSWMLKKLAIKSQSCIISDFSKISVEQDINLNTAQLVNNGHLSNGGKIIGHEIGHLDNQGIIESHNGFDLKIKQFNNAIAGRILGDGTIQVNSGQNKGNLGSDTFVLTVGDNFTNLGLIKLVALSGASFSNQGTIYGLGQPTSPVTIDVTSWHNAVQADQPGSGQVIANNLTFGSTIKLWSHNSGLLSVDDKLSFAIDKSFAATFSLLCQGNLEAGQLLIDAPNFNLSGQAVVDHFKHLSHNMMIAPSGKLQIAQDAVFDGDYLINQGQLCVEGNLTSTVGHGIKNEGQFDIKGSTYLRTLHYSIFRNKGTVRFKGLALLSGIVNDHNIIAESGLDALHWTNIGIADIYNFFRFDKLSGNNDGYDYVINQGTLNLINAHVHHGYCSLENKGDLFLNNSTMTKNEDSNLTFDFINHKNLSVNGWLTALRWAELINKDYMEFICPGSPWFHIVGRLNNQGQIKLFGKHWRIESRNPVFTEGPDNFLRLYSYQNNGTIMAENDLTYAYPYPSFYGKLEAEGKLCIDWPTTHFSPQHLNCVKANKAIQINAHSFTVTEDIELDVPLLILRIETDAYIGAVFKVGALDAVIKKFFNCGLKDNPRAYLGTTSGPLSITAYNIGCWYGKIFGQGSTTLVATDSDIAVGSPVHVPSRFDHVSINTTPITVVDPHYNKTSINGAYVASGADLTLIAQKQNVVIDYGQLFSVGNMTLQAWGCPGVVHTIAGKIQCGQDLRIATNSFVATSAATMIKKKAHYSIDDPDFSYYFRRGYISRQKGAETYYGRVYDLTLQSSDGALVQALRDIVFQANTVNVTDSQILAGNAISKNNIPIANKIYLYSGGFNLVARPQQAQIESRDGVYRVYQNSIQHNKGINGNIFNLDQQNLATVKGGQFIAINDGQFKSSGNIDAFVIRLRVTTALFDNPSRTRKTTQQVDLLINLAELAKFLYGANGFIKTLPSGHVTTDQPLSGGFVPDINHLVFTGPAAGLAYRSLNGLNNAEILYQHNNRNSKIPQFIIDSIPLEFVLQQALAQYVGSLNINGLAGRKLLEQLFANAGTFRQQQGPEFLDHGMLSSSAKSAKAMISYVAKEVAGYITLSAQLHVPASAVNPLQDNGDTTGHVIDSQTTGSQTHSGNRMAAQRLLRVFAGGQMNRETKKYTTYSRHGMQQTAGLQQEMTSGGAASILSQNLYRETGVASCAAGELERGSLGADAIFEPLILTRVTTTTHHKKGNWYRKSSTTTTSKSSHQHVANTGVSRNNDSHIRSGDDAAIHMMAPQEMAAGDLHFEGGNLYTNACVTSAQTTTNTTSSGGLFGGRQTSSKMSQRPEVTRGLLAAGRNIFFDLGGKAQVNGCDVAAINAFNNTGGGLSFGPTVKPMYAATSQSASSSFGAMHASQQAMQEIEARTRLFIDNIISPNSTTEAINVDYLKQPVIEGLYHKSCYKLQKWQQSQGSASGVYDSNVVAVFSLAVAVAFTIATGGVGSPLLAAALGAAQGGVVAAAAAASICQLTTQAALSLARTGDPLATGKELPSDKSLRDLVVTAVSAGAIKGLSGYLKVSTQPHGFTEQARYHLLKAGVNIVCQTTIGGQNFKDTWKANMFRAAVDTAAGTAANKIGEAYKGDDPTLNYITHKIAHGIVGGITGAVVADDAKRGAIAGAIGGIVSEMVAEQFSASSQSAFDELLDDSQGQRLDQKAFEASYDQKINGQMAADFGRLGAGLVSLFAKQDVDISIQTATNAVENNFIPAVIAGGLLAWEAYDIYCTARDEGFEAAALKLGFNFVVAATGAYAGKQMYQLGTIAVPTAIEAIQAYKHASPVFAKLYDQAGKVMTKGAQAYQKFDAKLGKAWNKTTSKVGEKVETTNSAAKGFKGQKGYELKNPKYQPLRNEGTTINSRQFSGHALDQMQNRGITPSVVENTIKNGSLYSTNPGTHGFYDSINNVRVILNSKNGKVITVIGGKP